MNHGQLFNASKRIVPRIGPHIKKAEQENNVSSEYCDMPFF